MMFVFVRQYRPLSIARHCASGFARTRRGPDHSRTAGQQGLVEFERSGACAFITQSPSVDLQAAGFSQKQNGTLVDGSGQPVEFTILVSSSNVQRAQMATLVQDDLTAIGHERSRGYHGVAGHQ